MKSKIGIRRIVVAAFAVVVLVMCLVAGYYYYRHEHEVNSRIAEIGNSVQAIETAMTYVPEKLVEEKTDSFLSTVNEYIAEEYDLDAYQKIANGQDIKILFVGDSICNYAWVGETVDWIRENYNIDVTYRNMSFPANDSYAGYVTVKRMETSDRYDLAVICYGQNDSPEGFSVNYEAMVRALLEKNSKCRIVSILEAPQREYNDKMIEIQKIADYYDIAIADAIATHNYCGDISYNLFIDGVHPSEAGCALYLKAVTEALQKEIDEAFENREKLVGCLIRGESIESAGYSREKTAEIPKPIDQAVEKYDNFRFIPAGDFERVSETAYEIEIEPQTGMIGIDRFIVPGVNTVKIYSEGELICEATRETSKSFELEYIYPLEEKTIGKKIRVEVETADKFLGLILTGGSYTEELENERKENEAVEQQ